jgi:hypothetical protein
MGGTLCTSVATFRRNDDQSQRSGLEFLEWSWNLGLDRLTDLQQVVVEPCIQWYYEKEGE